MKTKEQSCKIDATSNDYFCPSTHLARRHILGETLVLLGNLIGQFARVAQNQDGYLPVHRIQLLEGRQDEDGRLAHTRLGLAKHVHAQDRLRNAFVLH